MLFEEIRELLTDEELAAIKYLEACGFCIMTEARLDDCKQKDGKRVRTFSLSGRYAVMLGLKSVEDRIKALQPEVETEPEPEVEVETEPEPEVEAETEAEVEVSENAEVELESDEALPEETEESEPEPLEKEEGDELIDNFWMDEDRWKMMSTDGFFQLVVEEALDDLKKAPADVQEAVKKKFDRLAAKHDLKDPWPLGE